jgi:uridine phosphorylase
MQAIPPWAVWVWDTNFKAGGLRVVLTGDYKRCRKVANNWKDKDSVALVLPYSLSDETTNTPKLTC